MLILTQSDVRAVIGMGETIDIVERALIEYAAGRADIPPRSHLEVKEVGGHCLFMPGYMPTLGSLGQKIVVEFPRNADEGLPVVTGLFILLDERTGLPLAVMDARYLTSLRTGAVTGVALRYLAPRKARVAAMLGTGGQAPGQIEALLQMLPNLEEIRVWGRRSERAQALIGEIRHEGVKPRLYAVDQAEVAVRGADVVVVATSAREPVVRDEWIADGTLVCAIGSHRPDMQEVESGVIGRADKVVADTRAGVLAASGEVLIPIARGLLDPARVWELGAVASGQRPGWERDNELIFFKSTGFAALDLAVGKAVAERAEAEGLGVRVDILG